jgi:exopolysaccharide production protein ExoZ
MSKKFDFLQISRGIAALIVVVHHTTGSGKFYLNFIFLDNIFVAGWNAVDFFFVLSGFIIYYIHFGDIGKPPALLPYLKKRVIRVYPIYWIICFASLALLIIGKSYITKDSLFDIFSSPSYVVKSFLLIPQITQPFVGVAWSLCYEVFFYFVFGLGILFGRHILSLLTLTYLFILLLTISGLYYLNGNFIYSFLSSNYILDFLIGIAVVRVYKSSERYMTPRKWISKILLFTGISLFALTWFLSLHYDNSFGKFSTLSRCFYGIASAIIILSLTNLSFTKKTNLGNYFLDLGAASYVLYLVHPILLSVIFKLLFKFGFHHSSNLTAFLICFLSVVVCLVASLVFHKKVERPLLAYLNRNNKVKTAPTI